MSESIEELLKFTNRKITLNIERWRPDFTLQKYITVDNLYGHHETPQDYLDSLSNIFAEQGHFFNLRLSVVVESEHPDRWRASRGEMVQSHKSFRFFGADQEEAAQAALAFVSSLQGVVKGSKEHEVI